MGFLSDLGLDNVDADPGVFPDGKYDGYLTDCKMVQFKDTSKGQALVLTYKIQSDDAHNGKTIDEWKTANAFDSVQQKAWLKARIKSLGVPEAKINEVDPADLIGTPIRFTKKQKGEYHNVTFVEARDPDSKPVDFSSPAGGSSNGADISDLL